MRFCMTVVALSALWPALGFAAGDDGSDEIVDTQALDGKAADDQIIDLRTQGIEEKRAEASEKSGSTLLAGYVLLGGGVAALLGSAYPLLTFKEHKEGYVLTQLNSTKMYVGLALVSIGMVAISSGGLLVYKASLVSEATDAQLSLRVPAWQPMVAFDQHGVYGGVQWSF